jgi:hypothetical protein
MAVIFISDGAGGLGITPIAATGLYNGPKSGSVEVSTSVKEHGYGSFVHDSAGGLSAYINRLACLSDAGRRISLRVRFSAFPTSTSGIVRLLTGTTTLAELRMDSAGKIRLYAGASGGALQATGTTVMAVDTWYRISLAYTISSASVSEWRVYLDGVLELTASNPASQPTGSNNLRIGWTGNNPGTSKLMYHQDLYVDDGTGLDDPGDIRVTSKRPAGTGAANDFNTVVGASANRWTAVSELPATTTNMWRHTATSQVAEQYTVQAASVGDDDITGKSIVCWAPWVYWSIVTGAGSTLISMYANGSLVGLTSTAGSNAFQTMESIVASTSYPSGNTDVGLRSTGTAVDTNLAECGIFIAYVDSSSVDATGTVTGDTVPLAYGSVTGTAGTGDTGTVTGDTVAITGGTVTGEAITPVAAEYGSGRYGIDYYNTGSGGVDATGTVSADTVPLAYGSVTGTAGIGDTGTITGDTIPLAYGSITATAGASATGTITGDTIPLAYGSVTATTGAGDSATITGDTVPVTGGSVTGTSGALGTVSGDTVPIAYGTVSATAGTSDTGTVSGDTVPIVGGSITGTAGALGTVTGSTVVVSGQTVTGNAGSTVDATGVVNADTVPITGGTVSGTAEAIASVTGDVVPISGDAVIGTAGTSATGTVSGSTVVITGGSVTGTAGTSVDATGTVSADTIPVAGGSVTATTGAGDSASVTADTVPITGGTVSGTANALGQVTTGAVIVTGGTVTATTGQAAAAIVSGSTVIISGGTVTGEGYTDTYYGPVTFTVDSVAFLTAEPDSIAAATVRVESCATATASPDSLAFISGRADSRATATATVDSIQS